MRLLKFILVVIMTCGLAQAATYTKTYTFSNGSVANANEVNSEIDGLTNTVNNIESANIADGTIVNADISNSAAISIAKIGSSGISNGKNIYITASPQASAKCLEITSSSDVTFTDLDLTAYTSANATYVLLGVYLSDTGAGAKIYFRKNGASPAAPQYCYALYADVANKGSSSQILVPLDTDEVIEYYLDASGTNTASCIVYVIGYMEDF